MNPTFKQIMNAVTARGGSGAGDGGVLVGPDTRIAAVAGRPDQPATPMNVVHRLARAERARVHPAGCRTAIFRPAGFGGH